MATIEYVAPVKGAAEYRAYGLEVYMITPEGDSSVIDSAKSVEATIKKAISWQKKENKAVTKSLKGNTLKSGKIRKKK